MSVESAAWSGEVGALRLQLLDLAADVLEPQLHGEHVVDAAGAVHDLDEGRLGGAQVGDAGVEVDDRSPSPPVDWVDSRTTRSARPRSASIASLKRSTGTRYVTLAQRVSPWSYSSEPAT